MDLLPDEGDVRQGAEHRHLDVDRIGRGGVLRVEDDLPLGLHVVRLDQR